MTAKDSFSKIEKDKKEDFQISHDNLNIIILALTFLSLVLVQIMIAVYQNTIVPIPKWVNWINTLPFVFSILLLAYLVTLLERGYFWRVITLK